jgi:hypothetical protein
LLNSEKSLPCRRSITFRKFPINLRPMASTPIEQAHPTPSPYILRVCREEMLLLWDFFQKKSNYLCGMGSRMWKKGDFWFGGSEVRRFGGSDCSDLSDLSAKDHDFCFGLRMIIFQELRLSLTPDHPKPPNYPNSRTQLPPNNRQQLGGLRFHQRMIASGFHI